MTDLATPIATIERLLATRPNVDMSKDYFAARRTLGDWANQLRRDIAAEIPDAKISESWEVTTVRIAGIKSSSTSSLEGALRNWCTAARKRTGVAA